ncbi:MAG: flagellar hook-length control protein FliK [Chromatiaceae bacterium]|nr:flagellar hook-length control protein FliK [Chromatiaceae bacterium]
MKIPNTLQPLLDAVSRDLPALVKQLKVGQILQARVLNAPQPGVLRLQIGSTELLARSQVALPPGSTQALEVIKTRPTPELRVLREPTRQETQQQVVRSAMARQLPPQEIRQAAAELRSHMQTPRQVEAARQFVEILEHAAVRPEQLKPAQLQRAVALSGLFHESRMATGEAAEPADLKTRLLRLAALLKAGAQIDARADVTLGKGLEIKPGVKLDPQAPAPPGADPSAQGRDPASDSLLNRLARLVEGAVSRIQLQQTVALPTDDNHRQAWQIDLPIRLPDTTEDLMLRIERDAAADAADGAPGWAVNLAFQFDSIGTLQCRIALNGERVATTFWCESASTQQRVEARLPVLEEALAAQGLEVVHLSGVLGAPPEPLIRVPMPDSLLDERA